MRAVVIGHGDVAPEDRIAAAEAALVVAADGGATQLERWGLRPHVVVGDMDSLGDEGVAALARAGVAIERHPAEKEQSDLELAVERAIAAGASEIVLLGALAGARLDHELANLLLLADPAYASISIEVRRGSTRVRAVRGGGSLAISGPIGTAVTLLAVGGDAEGVRTEGLRYPLRGESLRLGRSRGLSNELSETRASVSLGRGSLLVFEIQEGGVPCVS